MKIELMKVVERAVRTLPCDKSTKLRMRDELYTQLEQIYEEELAKHDDESIALDLAKRRFGDSATLREELLGTISWRVRFGSWIDQKMLGRAPGVSDIAMLVGFGVRLGMLLLVFFVVAIGVVVFCWQDYVVLYVWPTFLAISILVGVNVFIFAISGLGAVAALRLEEDRVRMHSLGRFILATIIVGTSLALSFGILLEVARKGAALEMTPWAYVGAAAAAMVLFVTVVGLMAKIELRDQEWSALDLSEN